MFQQDPVCGSAHCVLAPYWGGKLGKQRLMAFQVCSCKRSTLLFPQSTIKLVFDSSFFIINVFDSSLCHQASPRSGILHLELEPASRRVRIQGEAVTVMTGTLVA